MPGLPSIYYGSEFGLDAKKEPYSDVNLRPALDLKSLENNAPQDGPPRRDPAIIHLAQAVPAILLGNYQEMLVSANQLAFLRQYEGDKVLVVLNSASQAAEVHLERCPGRAVKYMTCSIW